MSVLIEVENLKKIYGQENGAETSALDGVSFTITAGEFLAIMGPSGSGKSTLLHMLAFLDKPTSGIYRFMGKNRDQYTEPEMASIRNKKMGFVFQTFNLLARSTVYENVKLPLIYSDTKSSLWDDMVKKAIEAVRMTHRIKHEPSQLSGGEKQRVAIARALINNPEIIFADEPTGNLDSKSGQIIMQIIQELNEKQKHTVVLITHETYTAEHAHRIIQLKDGKIESDNVMNHNRIAKDGFKK